MNEPLQFPELAVPPTGCQLSVLRHTLSFWRSILQKAPCLTLRGFDSVSLSGWMSVYV